MRPVFNRPEMLQLSLEYEIKARESCNFPSDLTTLFAVEHGSPKKTLDLIRNYPFKSSFIQRPQRYGLTVNILEGFKSAFKLADDYVIYIEDDILVHETYFQYMDVMLNMVDDFSVLSAYNFNDNGDVNEVYRYNHYAALAPLISKKFHTDYMLPHSNKIYYAKPAQYVINLGKHYKEHWGKACKDGKFYKYKDTLTHHAQAGLCNRLTDVAAIEDDLWVYMLYINRQQHVGIYGFNRPGDKLPGNSFEERLENLREIIKDANKMLECAGTKAYKDYAVFSPKLESWSGVLKVV